MFAVSMAWSQERFALIVGNDVFAGATPLSSPAKDAFDVSAAMIGLGFNVRRLRNAGRQDLWATIDSVGKTDGPVLFFYSGPVFAANGKTYLVPAGSGEMDVADASSTALPLDDIVGALSAATQQEIVVILEVCQERAPDSPAPGSFAGLGQIAAPDPDLAGVFYGFSQAPGAICDPADPQRTRITDALLAGLKRPGLAIADLLAPTQPATGAGPWIQDGLTSAFVPNQATAGTFALSQPASGVPADGQNGAGIVVATSPLSETIVVTSPIRPVVFAPASAPVASGTPQFGASAASGVIEFAASAQIRADFDPPIDTGLPEPSVIVGRIRPTPASFPTVDLGIDTQDGALTGQELLFSDRDARSQLRQENPELFLTLLENGLFDPPDDQLVRAIQTELARMQCYTSRVDGRWGGGSRRSVTRFYAAIDETSPSADPTLEIYRQILLREDVVCTPVRAATTVRQPARRAAQPPAAATPAPAPTGRRIINQRAIGVNR